MAKINYELTPQDVLFFRDARPMDVDKDRTDEVFNVGHGANWPRPDQLFSAVIHELIKDPNAPEKSWYGEVKDLRVTGPFPFADGKLYLPVPLDWDMKLYSFDSELGVTDIPKPLTAGFADRVVEKKSYPKWISVDDYARYLAGTVGAGKDAKTADEPAAPTAALFFTEPRVGTTLDAATGASKRVEGKHECGQYEAEYLRLGKGVKMLCAIETEKAEELKNRDVRFGGQGGLVRCEESASKVFDALKVKERGKASRFVRWTLLTPALFAKGWYPNWLEAESGKVMLPMDKVLRNPGESRAAYRARMQSECRPFESAKLIAAAIGKPVAFSGYDSLDHEKPTELAVPSGSCYVFECASEAEAGKLVEALDWKPLSDLGEKGFGLGVCSYVSAPEAFTMEKKSN